MGANANDPVKRLTGLRRWLYRGTGLLVEDDGLVLPNGNPVSGGGGGAETLSGDVTGTLSGTDIPTTIGAGKVLEAMIGDGQVSLAKAKADLLAAIAAAGAVQVYSTTLTNAQVGSLSTTPRQIVAAPGAGIIRVPICAFVEFNVPTGYGANLTLSLGYGNPPNASYGYIFNAVNVGGFAAARNWSYHANFPGSVQTLANNDRRNAAIYAKSSADLGTGDTGGVMKISVVAFDFTVQ